MSGRGYFFWLGKWDFIYLTRLHANYIPWKDKLKKSNLPNVEGLDSE